MGSSDCQLSWPGVFLLFFFVLYWRSFSGDHVVTSVGRSPGGGWFLESVCIVTPFNHYKDNVIDIYVNSRRFTKLNL